MALVLQNNIKNLRFVASIRCIAVLIKAALCITHADPTNAVMHLIEPTNLRLYYLAKFENSKRN